MPDKNGKDEKITIITPDGNKMSGTRKELENLKVLGDYREESTKELSDRQIEKQRKKDYTTTGHKVGTFIAGAASGASLGLLEDRNNPEEAGLDAKYNPGTRLAGEIIGGALGSFAPVTPAGQVSKLADRASTAVGGGFKGALAAGAIEGAGAGLQAETSNATLTGTPLDIESVLGGIGTGAIFGAGLNAGIHGLGTGASKLGKKLDVTPPSGPTQYVPKTKSLGTVDVLEDVHAPVSKNVDEIEIVNQDNYDVFKQNIADTKPVVDTVDNHISTIEQEMATLKADHAAGLKTMDNEVLDMGIKSKELRSKIPEANKEYQNELMAAKNDKVLAQHNFDKFTKEAESDIKLTQEQYATEVKSGGLHTSARRLESAYTGLVKKLNPATDELKSEITKNLRTALDDYKKLVKAGRYQEAHDLLIKASKTMQATDKAYALNLKIPDVAIGIKADPAKTEALYAKISKYDEQLKEATKRLDDLKARGPRDYATEVSDAEAAINATKFERMNYPKPDFSAHVAELDELKGIRGALDDVRNFPATVKEFRGMQTGTINRLSDSLNTVIKAANKLPELQPLVTSLKNATTKLIESTGIKAEGNLVEQLKTIQKIAKDANKAKVAGPIRHSVIGQKNVSHDVFGPIEHEIMNIGKAKTGSKAAGMFGDYGAAMAASSVSKAVGVGGMGYFGIKHAILNGVDGLAGIKTAVQTKISKAAKAVGKTFQSTRKNYVVPKLQPLYTKLNGERDKDAKNAREAARNRINELMEMAPIAPDVLFKGLEPLSGGVHNEFFAGLHAAAVNSYNALIEMLPKDKFGTQIGFRNVWEPNDVETALTAKILDAYYDPVLTMEEAMKGNLDVTQIEVIKNCYPEMYQHMRGMVMQQVAENPTMTNTYQKQAALSHLLDIPVSSAFDPKNIIEGQSMFVNTPSVSNPNQGGGTRSNKGGAPPKTEPATAGQMNVMRE